MAQDQEYKNLQLNEEASELSSPSSDESSEALFENEIIIEQNDVLLHSLKSSESLANENIDPTIFLR